MTKAVLTVGGVMVFIKDTPRVFRQALSEALQLRPHDGCQADVFDVSFYSGIVNGGGHLFLAGDWSCGFYVSSEGEIGSLFKTPKSKAPAYKLLKLATKFGGKYFNAYGTKHLENLYVSNGFRPVARMVFDINLAPNRWGETDLRDKPDVVFFVYDPKGYYKVGDGSYFYDWDDAFNLTCSTSKRLHGR